MPRKTDIVAKFEQSWSYSKFSCYKLCPFQFKCRYIDKIKEPPSPHLTRGIKVHEEAENFLKGVWDDVPKSCEKLKKEFKIIRDKGYLAEEEWGFTEDWDVVPFKSAEAKKPKSLRMKVDAQGFPTDRIAKIIDFKTGKVRDNYQDQVELYTVAMFTHYDVDTVLTELWYLDHGYITPEVEYHVDDYDKLVKKWKRKITPMYNDNIFAPNPNPLCKNYCNFAKHKSGHCRYG